MSEVTARITAALAAAALMALSAVPAVGDEQTDALKAAGLYAPSAFDLVLGTHALDLPKDEFIEFACGTNGGPPAVPLKDWSEYGKCRAEPGTGWHEVYFKYDNEPEFWAKARNLVTQTAIYEYTSAYQIPIIVSGLFNDNGFLIGIRMVTDPRVPIDLREHGLYLGNFLQTRYGGEWKCEALSRLDTEQEYLGAYVKDLCRGSTDVLNLTSEQHSFRKAGQLTIDPNTNQPTEGQFESSTRFEFSLKAGVPGEAALLAALKARGPAPPTEKELNVQRAKNCPGCDLSYMDLKRADLTGANLAGANLYGANLHEAVLAGANLTGAILEKANLNRADIKRAQLAGANLKGVMMYETRFDAANLTGADLTQALGSHVQMIGAKLINAKLPAVDLRSARLNDADFTGANLSESWMHEAQMTRSNFTGAKLIEVILAGATMIQTNLTGANLSGADLIRVNLRDSDLTKADFSYARLTLANMTDTTTDGANFTDAELPPGFEPK